MGWNGGDGIMGALIDALNEAKVSAPKRTAIYDTVAESMNDQDWEEDSEGELCRSDLAYRKSFLGRNSHCAWCVGYGGHVTDEEIAASGLCVDCIEDGEAEV